MKYILIILAFLPLFGNAQDTIKIPIPVAKQIVKDLIIGDSAVGLINLEKITKKLKVKLKLTHF